MCFWCGVTYCFMMWRDVSWHQLWNTEMLLRLQMLWIRGHHPHGFSINCWRVRLGSSWKWWPHWGEQSRLGEQILQQTSTHVWFAGKLCNVSVKFFLSFNWIPFTMRITIGRKKYFLLQKNIKYAIKPTIMEVPDKCQYLSNCAPTQPLTQH